MGNVNDVIIHGFSKDHWRDCQETAVNNVIMTYVPVFQHDKLYIRVITFRHTRATAVTITRT